MNFVHQEWLFIDTHIPGRSCLGWLSLEGRSSLRVLQGRPILILRRLFGREHDRLKVCQGICVVAGPGSFSAIRIGVLYANLLARLLDRPLVGVSVEEAADQKALVDRLKRQAIPPVPYVAPIYNMEPNITVPRV